MQNILTRKVTAAQALCVPAFVLALSTIFGFLSALHWFLDLFAHFRVQYAISFLILAAVFSLLKAWRFALLCMVGFAVNAVVIAPLYFRPSQPHVARGTTYRLVSLNVETANIAYDKVRAFLESADPHILVLQEVDERWLTQLSPFLNRFPFSKVESREDNFGIGIWSKLELSEGQTHYLGEAEVPTLSANAALPSGVITIIATHPVPPGGAISSYLRNEQVSLLPQLTKRATNPILLVGDLNMTPWSSHFRKLLVASGLRNSAQGRGVQASWPTKMPLFFIPLDHCLHSAEVEIRGRKVGPAVGSDHLPLTVDLGL